MLTLKDRLDILQHLYDSLVDLDNEKFTNIIWQASIANPWFTPTYIEQSLQAIKDQFLQKDILQRHVDKYHIDDHILPQKVGLILAGNIPLVGFHDVLCCFLTGHHCLIKLSDKDSVLMRYVIDICVKHNPQATEYLTITDKLNGYDAIIATGSNQTASQFKYYFKDVKHIIRQNRNSLAIIHGDESIEELQKLGQDVFSYFGLGCRNVSKLMVPKSYDITTIFEAFEGYKEIINHNKYKNNYDYNVALNLLNKESFLQNEFFILKEAEAIISRIGVLHYQFYNDMDELKFYLASHHEEIQCVLSAKPNNLFSTIPLGSAQCPRIDDYADNVDTIQFLLSI